MACVRHRGACAYSEDVFLAEEGSFDCVYVGVVQTSSCAVVQWISDFLQWIVRLPWHVHKQPSCVSQHSFEMTYATHEAQRDTRVREAFDI